MSLQEEFFSAISSANIQKVARALLSSSLNINVQNSEGQTAILLAALHSNLCIAKMLMVFGADPNIKDKYGMTAISMATVNNTEILEILQHTEEEGKYPEQKVSIQEMFFYAVSSKQIKRAVFMLANTSTMKIDAKNEYGNTAVHLAVSNNDLHMLEILAAFRANLNIQDDQGNTALFTAILGGSLDMIQTLLKLGAGYNICNIRDNFPIHLAVERRYLTIINQLCTEDTVNRKNFNGLVPLHLAIRHNSVGIVEKLLLCDHIDINIRDNNGDTPLIMAAKNDCLEIVRLLLKHGVNPSLKNYAGKMFSDFASSQGMECLATTVSLYGSIICSSSPLKRKGSMDGMDDESDKNSHRPKVESLEYTYQKPLDEQNTTRRFAIRKRKNLTNTSYKCESFLNMPGISLPKAPHREYNMLDIDSPASSTSMLDINSPASSTSMLDINLPASSTSMLDINSPASSTNMLDINLPASSTNMLDINLPASSTNMLDINSPASSTSMLDINSPKSASCGSLSEYENFSNMSNIVSPESPVQRRCRLDTGLLRSTSMGSPRSVFSRSPYKCENFSNISDISLGGSSFRSDSIDMFDISPPESNVSQSSYMSRCGRYFSTLDLNSSECDSPKSSAKRIRLR
ncbi:ankyrin repeat domain-containing protein [Candidatus Mesenet endosymbiont of Agriotes lineatus]|uniref:ankyrin repeat domain-containing protein n=1 Tax=Candidatus Mesenet endosymbiont of Agriotes lineatus TaxID=3077948 RepID=UPI0030CE9EF3